MKLDIYDKICYNIYEIFMEMNNKIMENIEIWKDIQGYEGFYQVSNLGRVKSVERDKFLPNGTFHSHLKEKILAPFLNNKGYSSVKLCKNGKKKAILIHRLVAEAFLPNPENKSQINHKDEVKSNNAVDNLEWCTSVYNNNFGTRKERQIQNRRNYKLGNHPKAKPVFCEELNKKFDCIASAQEELGINRSCVGKACRGERNTAGGFHWRFADD